MELVFDIETTPIDKERPWILPKTIHCIIAQDPASKDVYDFGPGEIEKGAAFLQRADRLVGHQIAGFDIPVLESVLGDRWRWSGEIFDTYAISRLVYASNLLKRSIQRRNALGRTDAEREEAYPAALLSSHSLEAWGCRVRMRKAFADVDESFFREWSEELHSRCRSDVCINTELYGHLLRASADWQNGWPLCSLASMLSESRVAYIVAQQERNGVGFDRAKAGELFAELSAERDRLERKLREAVPAWLAPKGAVVTPMRSMVRTKGLANPHTYTAGAQYQRIQTVEFQPGSAQHRWWALAGRRSRTVKLGLPLDELVHGPKGYGWQPSEFTPEGQAVTDEETLADLPYPIIPDLLRYVTVAKRLGQLSDGTEAWLKHEKAGVIRGRIHVTGTRTSRASHSKPNLGQVPKVSSPYGPDCRGLFRPTRPDWVQVGVDAKALELRMLAHRLAPYDSGAFIKTVLEGDPHALWMKGTGIFIRDNQKTWTYAFLYGAGNEKLGLIILADWRAAFEKGLTTKPAPALKYAEALGKESRSRLLQHFGALESLLMECAVNFGRGWFMALDGRVLACPSQHGALNDLLQSDGAILMKHAMVVSRELIIPALGKPGTRWAQMLWVHDEIQYEAAPDAASSIGVLTAEAITEAGVRLGVRCRMDGDVKVGGNWCETH